MSHSPCNPVDLLPLETVLYLTRRPADSIALREGNILEEDSMYTLFDLRQDGRLVVPRGTRCSGHWKAEEGEMWLEIDTIHLPRKRIALSAISAVSSEIQYYDSAQVKAAPFLLQKSFRLNGHRDRRTVTSPHLGVHPIVLTDRRMDNPYNVYHTGEVVVHVVKEGTVDQSVASSLATSLVQRPESAQCQRQKTAQSKCGPKVAPCGANQSNCTGREGYAPLAGGRVPRRMNNH